MEKDIISKVYGLILSIRIVTFFVFLLMNIYSLDSIEYELAIPGFDSSFGTLSFYEMVALIGLIFALVLVTSIGFFGTGFNSAGTILIVRYVSSIFLWLVLGLGLSYFLEFQPAMSFIIEILSTAVFVLHILRSNANNGENIE